jgi:hypothetical protein
MGILRWENKIKDPQAAIGGRKGYTHNMLFTIGENVPEELVRLKAIVDTRFSVCEESQNALHKEIERQEILHAHGNAKRSLTRIQTLLQLYVQADSARLEFCNAQHDYIRALEERLKELRKTKVQKDKTRGP